MMEIIMGKENFKRAKLIKSLRERRGWTQEHLASVSGLTERTIQRIEKDGKAGKESLMALSIVLNIEIEKLMEEDAQKKATDKVDIFPCITNGKEALETVIGSDAFNFDYQYIAGEDFKNIVIFLDFLKDIGEIGNDASLEHQLEWIEVINVMIESLSESGFLVFGKIKKTKLKSNMDDNGIDFNISTIYLMKKESAGVFEVNENFFFRGLVPINQKISF